MAYINIGARCYTNPYVLHTSAGLATERIEATDSPWRVVISDVAPLTDQCGEALEQLSPLLSRVHWVGNAVTFQSVRASPSCSFNHSLLISSLRPNIILASECYPSHPHILPLSSSCISPTSPSRHLSQPPIVSVLYVPRVFYQECDRKPSKRERRSRGSKRMGQGTTRIGCGPRTTTTGLPDRQPLNGFHRFCACGADLTNCWTARIRIMVCS
ncbi:hypothetical protein DFH06DRAFT_1207019 [Mycena polygramma]|nr:hypothetical protein DFH06DRAFT_1207019 [Mycena polygramma]